MDRDNNTQQKITPREGFLLSVINKVTKEYKALLDYTRRIKPLKIVDIKHLSTVPGETRFAIQLTNKNCVLNLTAAEIIESGYRLDDFNDFHAQMIQQAAAGKLLEFLQLREQTPLYQVTSKKYDRESKQFQYTIETKEKVAFVRTAEELAQDKNLLLQMNFNDVLDIGYTQGCESILREKAAMALCREKMK